MATVSQNIMNSIVQTAQYKAMSKSIGTTNYAYQYFLGDIFDTEGFSKSKIKANQIMQSWMAHEWNTARDQSSLLQWVSKNMENKDTRAKANSVITKMLRNRRNRALRMEEQLYIALTERKTAEGEMAGRADYMKLNEKQRIHFWTAVANGYYNAADPYALPAEALFYAMLKSPEVKKRIVGKYHTARRQKKTTNAFLTEVTGISEEGKTREQFEQEIMDYYYNHTQDFAREFRDLFMQEFAKQADLGGAKGDTGTIMFNAISGVEVGTTFEDLMKKLTKIGEAAFEYARGRNKYSFDKVSIRNSHGQVVFTYVAGKGTIKKSKESTKRKNREIKEKNKEIKERNKTRGADEQIPALNKLGPRQTFFNAINSGIKSTPWGKPLDIVIDGQTYTVKPNRTWNSKASGVLFDSHMRDKFEKDTGPITDEDLSNSSALFDRFTSWYERNYKAQVSRMKKALKSSVDLPKGFEDVEDSLKRIDTNSSKQITPYFTRKQKITLGKPMGAASLDGGLFSYFSEAYRKETNDADDVQVLRHRFGEGQVTELVQLLKFISVNENFINDFHSDFTSRVNIGKKFESLMKSLIWTFYPTWASSEINTMGGLVADPKKPIVFLRKGDYVYPLSQIYKEIYNNFSTLNNIDQTLNYSIGTSNYKTAYKNMDVSKNLIDGGNIQYKNNFKIKFAGLTISLLNLALER